MENIYTTPTASKFLDFSELPSDIRDRLYELRNPLYDGETPKDEFVDRYSLVQVDGKFYIKDINGSWAKSIINESSKREMEGRYDKCVFYTSAMFVKGKCVRNRHGNIDKNEPLHNVGLKADECVKENKQKFKKGDFLKDEFGNIFICNEAHDTCWENDYLGTAFCVLFNDMTFSGKDWIWKGCSVRYASEGEKERLLKAINENGYMWDEEKKELKLGL